MGPPGGFLLDAAANRSLRTSRWIWFVLHQKYRAAIPAIIGKSSLRSDSPAIVSALEPAFPSSACAVPVFSGVLPAVSRSAAAYPHDLSRDFPSSDCAG